MVTENGKEQRKVRNQIIWDILHNVIKTEYAHFSEDLETLAKAYIETIFQIEIWIKLEANYGLSNRITQKRLTTLLSQD